MAARWRKQPDETGRRAVIQSPRGYELREDGQWILKVTPIFSSRRVLSGWYWYGLGQSTRSSPKSTKEGAKAEADAYYKAWKKADRTDKGWEETHCSPET